MSDPAALSPTSATSAPILTGLSDGFGAYYRPTDDQLRDVYARGIVVLDTNVLLDLYRLSPTARASMIRLLEALSSRIFVPYQVALEFHRNRAKAVADRRTEIEDSRGQLESLLSKTKGAMRHISTRAYGDANRARDIETILHSAFSDALAFADAAADEYDLNEDAMVGMVDEILTSLESVLSGRVASRPPESQLDSDRVEARRRSDHKEPPGFRDGAKSDNADGDYLWWAEVVRYAASQPAPVVIVGNDTAKGDWIHSARGIRIGLDPRLVDEMSRATGCALYLRSTSQFLEDGARLLNVLISQEAVNEARSLTQDNRPSQLVNFEDVAAITGLNSDEIGMMQNRGWVPLSSAQWEWKDVRRAAILGFAIKDGVKEDDLARISDYTLGIRPAGRNVLVVTADDCSWVKSREANSFVEELSNPPISVIPIRQFERRMRIIQASLQRSRQADDDDE